MKIFVPRYRHDLPHTNGHILNAMFVEIETSDLPRVIGFWRTLDQLTESGAKTFFKNGVQEVCQKPIKKCTLEPYLRRPHITVHCGAKEGFPASRQIAQETIYQLGGLIAQHGFNLWYGGGDKGLMGKVLRGFLDKLKERSYPDQYSIQVSLADFIADGYRSCNGMKPANEGLCGETDIAIILPDFVGRREALGNKCAAAITGIGGIGSLDETTDIWAHIKTGLRKMYSYVVNTFTPELNHGYYDALIQQISDCIQCGYEKPDIFDHIHFKASPQEVMDHLMASLEKDGQNPHIVYQAYCREHNIDMANDQASVTNVVSLVR